jgi:hypothetical protein
VIPFDEALRYHQAAVQSRCTGSWSYQVEAALLAELNEAIMHLRRFYATCEHEDTRAFVMKHTSAPHG